MLGDVATHEALKSSINGLGWIIHAEQDGRSVMFGACRRAMARLRVGPD